MPKLLVKTKGDFMLSDRSTGDVAQWNRPSVVTHSHFISQRIGLGQLILIANLRDDASDELLNSSLQKTKNAKEQKQLIKDFCEEFELPSEPDADEEDEEKEKPSNPADTNAASKPTGGDTSTKAADEKASPKADKAAK
ncbi:hypothetical protein [Kiloniella sp.]|uniref:hypothetical protein n=1 Tax=Kiloniella sp. TaxID=1938587 RepID=UPI003B0189FC